MTPKFFPTRAHLLLCAGQNCRQRGADMLALGAERALETQSLMYYKQGGSLRYGTSSCLGACAYGPTLCVYRKGQAGSAHLEEAWYAGLTLPRLLAIARAAHAGEPLPSEGRYGP